MSCKKCVKKIDNFICDVLNGDESYLCEYSFIRESYKDLKKINYLGIDYSLINYYFKSINLYEKNEYIENKNGKAEDTQIPYAIYSLLWGNLKCNHDRNNKITELIDINNSNYNGYKLNPFWIDKRKITSYCNVEKGNLETLINKLENFRIKCETIGNFMPMPIKLKQAIISNKDIGNQFDIYLKQVQKFYENNCEYKKQEYISEEFYNILKDNEKYFKLFKDFQDYMKKNYLIMYLDKNRDVKELFKRKKGQVLPETYKQLMKYLENVLELIQWRNEIMHNYIFESLAEEKIPIILNKAEYKDETKLEIKNKLKKIDTISKYEILRNLAIFPGKLYFFSIKNNEDLLKYKKDIVQCLRNIKLIYYGKRGVCEGKLEKALDTINRSIYEKVWEFHLDLKTLYCESLNDNKEEFEYVLIIGCKY